MENYKKAEDRFREGINLKINLIMLVGGGANGKSYLTNIYKDMLDENDYNIISSDLTYAYNGEKAINEINKLKESRNVMHMLYNPFENKENIENVEIIDMSAISF